MEEDIFYVQVAASNQNRVVLREVDRTLTGEYQCEVSADAPLFHTDIKAAEMVVVGKRFNATVTLKLSIHLIKL